jgi:4-amino-4-deoxy-L-arabinose transferase-like glycosyltransferase
MPAMLQSRRLVALLLLIVAGYIALVLLTVRARMPYRDEAWFASPALSLIEHGDMGTRILEEQSRFSGMRPDARLTRIGTRTYWVMPLHALTQAAWYELFGFGLYATRLHSLAWGLVALCASGLFMWRLTKDAAATTLALGLIASDFMFVTMSAHGRMDVMSAALGLSALACYAWNRDARFAWAVTGSSALASAAIFTHPEGILSVVGVGLLVLLLDLRKLRLRHVALAAGAFALFAGAFGLYCLQDWPACRDQLGSNTVDRFRNIVDPLGGLRDALQVYLGTYGFGAQAPPSQRVMILTPLLFALAIGLGWGSPAIRRDPGRRAILVLATVYPLFAAIADGVKLSFYLVHVTPLYCMVVAIVAMEYLRAPALRVRAAAILALAALAFVQVAPVFGRAWADPRARVYAPAVAAIEDAIGPRGRVIGSAELAFGLGFDRVSDDRILGFKSGARPEAIAISSDYASDLEALRAESDLGVYFDRLLSREYQEIFRNSEYTVFRKREREP